jgi:putative hemolysin
MSQISVELLVILVLISANGLFAMAELALLSARKPRLRHRAQGGDQAARIALELAEDPNRFLSTVQVGITLVGTLTGVFGGATLAEELARHLARHGTLAPYAETISLVMVVVGISYTTLVLGELVPKRLAMCYPERLATLLAWPLHAVSMLGVPLVRILSASTSLVLWVLRARPSSEPAVTEDEIKALVREGARLGVFEHAEQEMVQRVFRLGDRRVGALITPRTEVVWIDVHDPPDVVRRKVAQSPHSRFPVCEGDLDHVLGIVHAKDLLARGFVGKPFDFRGILTVPLFVYEGTPGLKVLEMFKTSQTHVALVLDEYGSVEGLVTASDFLEAIVGQFSRGNGEEEAQAIRRPDGSWLVDGIVAIDEFADLVEGPRLPNGDFETLAGFVITRLGRIPTVGDAFVWEGRRFEVVDMDGNRVDKVLVTPVLAEPPDPAQSA